MADTTGKISPMPTDLPAANLSENAIRVLNSRYLKRDDKGNMLETPEDMFWRVADTAAAPELSYGKNKEQVGKIARSFYESMASRKFLPNSPTLMNAGREMGMLSACFALPLEDSIEEIFDTIKATALIQKAGGGTGFSFDKLRPTGDFIKSSGGTTSGPITFWKALAEASNAIQQGSFRRGASMGMMSLDHPDILKFIMAKQDLSAFTNFNISVKISNAWMAQYDANPDQPNVVLNRRNGKKFVMPRELKIKDYDLRTLTPLEQYDGKKAVWTMRETLELVIDCAHRTGEPGLIFIDNINAYNTTPHKGEIETTNPCVSGDTKILTDKGYFPIQELVGQEVTVWNGFEWSKVVPRVTGENQKMREVTFSNGEVLKCTDYHRFPIMTNNNVRIVHEEIVEAKDLTPGMRLTPFTYPLITSGQIQAPGYAYTLGVYAGDGYHIAEKNNDSIMLYGEKKDLLPFLLTRLVHQCANDRTHVALPLGYRWKKTFVPGVDWSVGDRMQWLAGLVDTDGSACRDGALQIWSVEKEFLHDVQRMLVTCGVYSSISLGKEACTKGMPDGNGGIKEYECQDSWRINIPLWAVATLWSLGMHPHRVKTATSYSNKHMTVKVKEVREIGYADKVYCFTEPLRSRGTFGSVVTLNCGELPLLPYEACNLGSVNLSLFVTSDKSDLDWEALRETTWLATRFLDNVIDANNYPLPQIEAICKGNRKIGLGVMGLADIFYMMGIPYNSEEAVTLGEKVMKFINDESVACSIELAAEKGSFPYWEGSTWDTQEHQPIRNCGTTTVAPTGTISIIADCSGGIEPLFSLVFTRQVLNGQKMLEGSQHFAKKAKELGVLTDDLLQYAKENGSIQKLKDLPEDLRKVFVCTHDVSPEWHIKMQAAFQRHVHASVSKTINLSHEASKADVEQAYLLAWKMGCKGITVYRDGCRAEQPMSLETKKVEAAPVAAPAPAAVKRGVADYKPRRPMKTSPFMPAVRLRQPTPFGHMHVTISVDPQLHKAVEVFAQLGKAGDVASSDLEAICRMVSMYLRIGGSLVDIISQLEGIGSNVSMPTKNGSVKSIPDGLAMALKVYHLAKSQHGLDAILLGKVDLSKISLKGEGGLAQVDPVVEVSATAPAAAKVNKSDAQLNSYRLKCPECGSDLSYQEGCTKCSANCGYSKC